MPDSQKTFYENHAKTLNQNHSMVATDENSIEVVDQVLPNKANKPVMRAVKRVKITEEDEANAFGQADDQTDAIELELDDETTRINEAQNALTYHMALSAEIIRRKPGKLRMMRPKQLVTIIEESTVKFQQLLAELNQEDQIDLFETLRGDGITRPLPQTKIG